MFYARRAAAVLIAAFTIWFEGRAIWSFLKAAGAVAGSGVNVDSSTASSGFLFLVLLVASFALMAAYAYVHVQLLWFDPSDDSERRRIIRWIVIGLTGEHLLFLLGTLLVAGSIGSLFGGLTGGSSGGSGIFTSFLLYGVPQAALMALLWPLSSVTNLSSRKPAVPARMAWEHPAQAGNRAPAAEAPKTAATSAAPKAPGKIPTNNLGGPIASSLPLFAETPTLTAFTMSLTRQDGQLNLAVVDCNGQAPDASSDAFQAVLAWASTWPKDLMDLLPAGDPKSVKVLVRAAGVRVLPA